MCNPKVYVGTYGKYNSGSIAGGWISLADCENYNAFLSKCKELHKNESEPEFMIQDSVDFPDGLSCMEWLSEEDFNDIKAALKNDGPDLRIVEYSEKCFAVVGDTYTYREQLKKLGAWKFNKFLSCGAGWLFNNDRREAVEAFIGSGAVQTTAKAEKTAKKDEKFTAWLNEFLDTECKNDKSDRDYYGKGNVGAVKIDGHFYLIAKPSISNRFCFHDEGPDYDFYCTLMEDESKLRKYFIQKNESVFTRSIESIEKGETMRIAETGCKNKIDFLIGRSWYNNKGHEASEEERSLILEGLKFGLEKFRKRLDAYLNRYGVSKIHTWTYWADA